MLPTLIEDAFVVDVNDNKPKIFQSNILTHNLKEISHRSCHQNEYYAPDAFPSVVTQKDIDDVIHHQERYKVPVPCRGRRERRCPLCGT